MAEQSPYGINVLMRPNQIGGLDKCRDAGIGWVRMDINWSDMQPNQGTPPNWSLQDSFIQRASQCGLSILATIAYCPRWANGGRERAFPATNVAHWRDFVSAAVHRHAGKVSAWAIWNEPNLPQFFQGTQQEYLDKVLLPGLDAAKQAGAHRLVGPDLASIGRGWGKWLEAILVAARDQLHVVTHHIYKSKIDGYGGLFSFLDEASFIQELIQGPSLRSVLKRKGCADKEVWLTEVGWSTDDVSEDQQSRNYQALLEGMARRAWIKKVLFYEIMDDPNWVKKFGVVRADGSVKQAYATYKNWIHQGVHT